MATATKKTTKKTTGSSSNTQGNSDTSTLKRLTPITYIPSGNVGMDLALTNGKGVPLGSNIMLFGPPGTGKTTIISDVIKRILDMYKRNNIPMRVHYVDSESSRELLESTGLMEYVYDSSEYAPQQVIYHEHINSFIQLEDIYGRIITQGDNWSKDVHFIIIDSVSKLLSKNQLENDVDKADFGDNARSRKKLYGKWLSILQAMDITQFWVSQVAVVQDAGIYAEKRKPAVSEFDKHNMDIILKLSAKKDAKLNGVQKVEVNTIQGKKVNLTKYVVSIDPGQSQFVKNRHGQNIIIDILLWRGRGVVNAYILANILEANGWIKKLVGGKWVIQQELADFLGADALAEAKITNIEDVPSRIHINTLCSKNNIKLVQFIKSKDQYKIEIGEVDETEDGLF